MTRVFSATIVAAALSLPLSVSAQLVAYDFTGHGNDCTYTGSGSAYVCSENVPFTGLIVVNVNPSGPSGDDSYTVPMPGGAVAVDRNGWVTSSYLVSWSGMTKRWCLPVEGENFSENIAVVGKATGYNRLVTRCDRRRVVDGIPALESFGLFERWVPDDIWLSGLQFDTTVALAPPPTRPTNYLNVLQFWDREQDVSRNMTGSAQLVYLDTLTFRPVVPALLQLLQFRITGVGPGRSLEFKLKQVQAHFANSDSSAACGSLSGFVNEVEAQSGKKIDTTTAASLIEEARGIIMAASCQ